jgi:hypothetical protein
MKTKGFPASLLDCHALIACLQYGILRFRQYRSGH